MMFGNLVIIEMKAKEPYSYAKDVLKKRGAEYARKNERPLVVVIDNVNRLAKKNPQILEELQDFAKDTADRRTLRVVFVASEGNAPRFLEGKKLSISL